MRRIVPAVALTLATASFSIAGIPTKLSFVTANEGGSKTQYLAVRDGKLSLGDHTGGLNNARPDACRWYVLGSQVKSSVGGGYLAYDPTGKVDEVTLSPDPAGLATEWTITRQNGKGKNDAHSGADYDWATIRASAGPLKGRYLDVGRIHGKIGETPGYRLVLRESPRWNVEVGRIYTGK